MDRIQPGQEWPHKLLTWFDQNRRDLPWREGRPRNPYYVWVSEIMLQQTRTEAVKPYFESWKRRFPTIEALAEAEEADVLHAWQGLGYYSRARNLHKAAREIAEKYGGAIPEDKKDVRALPVVGYKKGLLTFAKEKALGEENTNKGLVGSASTLLLGSHKDAYGNEKSVSEKTVDTLLGEGAYSSLKTGVGNVGAEGADVYYRLKDTIGNVGAEGADVYHQLKGTLGNIGSEAGSLYYDGKEYVGGMFNGNGMVNHGNGYYDPTTAQYPSMSAVQGIQGQAGMGGGLMNNLNSALSNVTGGNISKMNLASLLLASYMMFGRFGWFSKIAGLALGGMTMKNVNQRSVQVPQQMNLPMQAAVAPQVAATPATEEDHSMTVHRRR